MTDELKIVYLVTSGTYSDYNVRGIYSTEEKAQEAKELFAADNYIEKIVIDEIPPHPEGMFLFSVRMDKDGECSKSEICDIGYQEVGWRPYGDGFNVLFHLFARDKEHAIKIANEKRIELLAMNKWETDFNKHSRNLNDRRRFLL